jgi:hypothetical protein
MGLHALAFGAVAEVRRVEIALAWNETRTDRFHLSSTQVTLSPLRAADQPSGAAARRNVDYD